MSEIQEEIPIKGISKTRISKSGLKQEISFYYNDPTEIYYSYIKADLLDELIDEVTENMQGFLSQDSFLFNNQDIPLVITSTQVDFYKNKRTKPILIFSIVNSKPLHFENSGLQKLQLRAEKEILGYPISSTWKFPGKILSIESPLTHKITGFNVIFSAEQGIEIGGIETFTFYYKNKA